MAVDGGGEESSVEVGVRGRSKGGRIQVLRIEVFENDTLVFRKDDIASIA